MILNGEGVLSDPHLAIIGVFIPGETVLLPIAVPMRHLIQTHENAEENRNADGRAF